MGQEVGWTFSGENEEKEKGWSFSVPQKPVQPTGPSIGPARGEKPVDLAWIQRKKNKEKTKKKILNAIGAVVEPPLALASGLGGFVVGTGSALANVPLVGPEKALQYGQKVSQKWTYSPQTKAGKDITKAASFPFALFGAAQEGAAGLLPEKLRSSFKLSTDALMLLSPYLKDIGAAKPLLDVKLAIIKSKDPVATKKAALETVTKAEQAGAKTVADITKATEPPTEYVGPERRGLGRMSPEDWEKMFAEEAKKLPPGVTATRDRLYKQYKEKMAAYEAEDLASQGASVVGEPRGGSVLPATELPKRVGPINLERLDIGEPAQKLVADMEDRLHQSRIKAGQVNIPWEESAAKAETLGGAHDIGQVLGRSAEELLADWGQKTKDLPAYVEATRTLFKTAFQEAQKAAKEAVDNPSPEATAKAQLAYNRWAIVQFSTGGGSSNIGRALNIHKKLARSKDMILTKNYARVLKELGHDTLTPEAMELLATFDESNPLPGMKFLAQARKATTKEKLFEIWINSILSNPGTHIVNLTSNLLFESMAPFERIMGAGVEFAKHPLKANKRELYFGEAAHSIVGAFHGMREGLNRYVYAMKHGQTVSGVSKFEAPKAAIKGLTGEIVRIPTKELMANDDFFKAIIYSDDIYAQAYRMATKEGLRGDVRKAKMAELIANPTEAMSDAANKAARTRTFQAELGKLGKDFMRMRSRVAPLEFIFPFVRTPVNVVKEGLRRTPFGIIEGHKLTGAEQSMAIGREAASLATAALIAKLITDGLITGAAPTAKAERERLYNTGWRPYSLKIGDTYYSYGRLEPMATYLGVMADSTNVFREMGSREWTKLAAEIGTAFRNNISNKTFLTGMTDVINATTDPGRYGEAVIKRMSTSLVPASGFLGGLAKATDPQIKDARNVVDWYRARLPGLSKQVPPKLNVIGEPQKTGGSPLARLLSPVAVSKEVKDPVYQELDRLGINLGPISATVAGKKLPPDKARAMVAEAGPEIKRSVYQLITSPVYKSQSDENKRKMLKAWITKTRAYQKGLFIIK